MRRLIGMALFLGGLAGCSQQSEPTLAHDHPVAYWVAAVHGRDPAVRRRAVMVLGNAGAADPAAVPALAAALKDRDTAVRREAAAALLKLGPAAREASAALREAAKDPDARVRSAAAAALGKMGG
jgi:HEAT repeat protein